MAEVNYNSPTVGVSEREQIPTALDTNKSVAPVDLLHLYNPIHLAALPLSRPHHAMSRAQPSPRRRKSLSLVERDLNRYDDDNMTLPITKGEFSRGRKRAVMSMGGEQLSQIQLQRRQAQPRKSILKPLAPEELDEETPAPRGADHGATIDLGALSKKSRAPRASMPVRPSSPPSIPSGSSRMSLGPRRRVSFAPSAYVRMFETEEKKTRRKSSMGARFMMPQPTSPRSPVAGPSRRPSLQASPAPAPLPHFVGQGAEEGEASMEIDEEESYASSADSDEIVSQIDALSPRRQSTLAVQDAGSDTEGSDLDMDETVAGGGITQYLDESHDSQMSFDTEQDDSNVTGTSAATDEEKTMDFTVALGGPMPSVPPADAQRTKARASIGYSVPAQGGMQPLLPGEGDDTSMEMEETGVYGGLIINDESVSSGEDTGNHDRSASYSTMAMEMTVAVGGIFTTEQYAEEDDMEFTGVHGGINDADESGLDFTVAGGGIVHQNTAVYGATSMSSRSMNTTNIFAPVSAQPTPRSTTPAKTPRSMNIFAASSLEENSPEDEDDEYETMLTRPRGSSATPARPTPGSAASRRGMQAGTPSFARPTSASAQKAKEKAATPTSAKSSKRNVFAPSPGTPSLSRSKSRTPAAAVAGVGAAADIARKLEFSAPNTQQDATTVPGDVFGQATPVESREASAHSTPARPRGTSAQPTPKSAAPSTTPARPPPTTVTATPRDIAPLPRSEPSSAQKRSHDVVDEDEDAVEGVDTPRVKRARTSLHPADMSSNNTEFHDAVEDVQEDADEADTSLEADEEEVLDEPQEGSEEFDRETTPENQETRPIPSYTPIPLSAARPSLGPPRRSVLPAPLPRSPTPEEPAEPTEPDTIPMAKFYNLVDLAFMDKELHTRTPRKSRAGNDRQSRGEEVEFALNEYLEGNVEAVFIAMWKWAAEQTKNWVKDGAEELGSIEKVCDDDNPIVVRQYLMADEEERHIFSSTLKTIKQASAYHSKIRFLDWKRGLLEDRILADVKAIRDDMVADAERHAMEREMLDTLLPELQKRRTELEAELATHRAQVAEVLECDQGELAALKEAVDEQDRELERFQSELDSKNERKAELEGKLAGLQAAASTNLSALQVARSQCDELTVSDVLRLEHELVSLEALHGWRITRVASSIELEYATELTVSIPYRGTEPALDRVVLGLSRVPCKSSPTPFLVPLAAAALARLRLGSVAELVDAISQIWTKARAIRDELRLLNMYFPATYAQEKDHVVCSATLMLPSVKGKARTQFALGPQALLAWPEAVRSLGVASESVYGNINESALTLRARETLAAADLGIPGVLLQACVEAADTYQ